MDKKRLDELNKAYENACNDILKAFAEEYEVQCDKDDWVAGEVGTTICINEEFYLNIEDMRLMLNKHVSWDEFLRWWDYNMDCAFLELKQINLRSWISGAPRYPQESIDKLKAMRKEIDELTKETIKDLEGY